MRKLRILLGLVAGLLVLANGSVTAQEEDDLHHEWWSDVPTEDGLYTYDDVTDSWVDVVDYGMLEEVVVEGQPWPVAEDGDADGWIQDAPDWEYYDEEDAHWYESDPRDHYTFSGGGGSSGGGGASGSWKVYKSFSYGNIRHNLEVLTGIAPAEHHAHHVFPVKFENRFEKVGINIHDPKYLAWWEAHDHLSNANAYNQQWEGFFETYPNPPYLLVIEQGYIIMGRYRNVSINF